MTTLIDCQELQVVCKSFNRIRKKTAFQREEIESLETIFGSAWSKYDENSETYRLALERNSQQSIELQVIHSKIIYETKSTINSDHIHRWLSHT